MYSYLVCLVILFGRKLGFLGVGVSGSIFMGPFQLLVIQSSLFKQKLQIHIAVPQMRAERGAKSASEMKVHK